MKKQNLKHVIKPAIVLIIISILMMSATGTIITKHESNTITDNPGEKTGSTIYVDDDNTQGPWDGSIDYPFQYIQDAIDNSDGGDVIYVFNGTYQENIVIFKSLVIMGENVDTTIIDGGETGTVVTMTTDGISLSGFTIQHSGDNPNNAGVTIHTRFNEINANIIQDNNIGIRFWDEENEVHYNNFFTNTVHAYDENINAISYNYWDTYVGEDDDENGIGDTPYNITGDGNKDNMPLIHIYGFIQNSDTYEIFFTIQDAIDDPSTNDWDTIIVQSDIYYEHLIIDKSIILCGEHRERTILDGREQGVSMEISNGHSAHIFGFTITRSGSEYTDAGVVIYSDKNIIRDTIIEHNFHGILLKDSSDDNNISNNIIRQNNWNGLYIQSSCGENTGNMVYENSFEDNYYAGIAVVESRYNYIYHNDFEGNLINAYDSGNNIWDDGYPSGGNYWDDYAGEDDDGDGIGDTPYDIDEGINKDQYPLMEPYSGEDNIAPTIEILTPENGLYIRNLRLLSRVLRQRTIIFGAVNVEVEASDNSGIEKVEFYIDASSTPAETLYDEPYIWTWTGGGLIRSKFTLMAVAYDTEGNFKTDMIVVRKFF